MRIAERQLGMITVSQLAGAGAQRNWIARRVRQGWLLRWHHGVYQVGPVTAPRGAQSAALLATGPEAALSHRTAAELWGLLPPAPGPIHVTTPRAGARPKPGLRLHRTHSLDAAVQHGLRLTAPARTLLDVAATEPRHITDRAIEQALIAKLTTAAELTAQRGRGAATLRRACGDEPRLTRSEAERRLLKLIGDARLPRPETNVRLAGWEVDMVWREQRVVVEIDGYAYHGGRHAFERDRRKDADLVAAGYRVVRLTWRQITQEPLAVAALLARMVA